jgi:hypothetical protein
MNSALSHNLDLAIRRSAPAFKINADEVSRRLLAVLFPVPTVTLPMAPPVPSNPPPKPVPAPKPVGFAFTPTLTKKFAEIEKEFKLNSGDRKTEFTEYVNQMAPKEYSAKTPQEHMREFLKPKASNAAAAPAAVPAPIKVAPPPKPAEVEVNENCVAVMYKGREYWVGEDSKRVYFESSEGVHDLMGMLGLAEFDGMEMPVVASDTRTVPGLSSPVLPKHFGVSPNGHVETEW